MAHQTPVFQIILKSPARPAQFNPEKSKVKMRPVSHLLLGSILGSAIFLFPGAYTYAQDAQTLSPTKGWSVTKVKEQDPQKAYCALSRPYSDNSVFNFGQNLEGKYSIALDKLNMTLEPGEPYALALQPSPGIFRAYEIKPQRADAFVVTIGSDEAFLDALTETELLKVKVADQEKSYQIKDFPAGLNDLASCLKGLKNTDTAENAPAEEAGKEVETKEASVKQKPADNSDEKAVIAATRDQQKDEAQKGIRIGQPKPQAVPSPALKPEAHSTPEPKPEPKIEVKAELKPSELDRKPSQKVSAQNETKVISNSEPQSRTLSLLNIEPVQNDKKFQATKMTAGAASPAANVEQDVTELAKAVSSLSPAAGAPDKTNELSAILKQEKLQSDQQVISLQKKLEEQRARINDLNAQIAKTATTRDVNTTKMIEGAKQEVAELQAKLEAAQSDNTKLLSDLERYQRISEDKLLGEAGGNWTLEQATKRFNESEREIRRLALELEAEKTSCRSKTAEIESMLFDPAVADQKQRQQLVSLEQELMAANQKLKERQAPSEAEIAKAVEEALKPEQQAKKALQSEIAALKTSLADKEMRLTQQTNIEGQAAKALEKEKADLVQKLAEKDRELQAVKTAKLTDAQQGQAIEKELQQAKAELAELNATKANLAANVRGSTETLSQKDKEIEALNAKITILNTQNQSLQTQLKAQEEQFKTVQTNTDSEQKAVKTMALQMAELKAQNDAAQDELITARTNLEKLRLQLAENQGGQAARADQLAALKIESERMRSQLSLKEKEALTYRNQVAGLQQDLAQNRTKLDLMETQSAQIQQQAQKLRQDPVQIQALQQEVQDMKRQMVAKDQQMQKNINALERDKQMLEARLARSIEPASGQSPNLAAVQNSLQNNTVPAPRAALQQVATQPLASPSFGQGSLNTLVSSAGIGASDVRSTGQGTYTWKAGSLNGTAQIAKASGAGQFGQNVKRFIASMKQKCSGDFASMPSSETRTSASYEVACVTPQSSLSSSILFFERQGSFVAVSHEIQAADMDLAMDARDRIASQLALTPVN